MKPATENMKWSEDMGITRERFNLAGGAVEVGGDERVGKSYHLKDGALERVYRRLKANPEISSKQRAQTEVQERALERYRNAFLEGGMMGSVGSIDLEAAGASNPGARDHAAKTNWQVDHRNDFSRANRALTANQRNVVRIIVLCDGSTEEAGRFLGKTGRVRAIQSAVKHLRDAGDSLAKLWGMG